MDNHSNKFRDSLNVTDVLTTTSQEIYLPNTFNSFPRWVTQFHPNFLNEKYLDRSFCVFLLGYVTCLPRRMFC